MASPWPDRDVYATGAGLFVTRRTRERPRSVAGVCCHPATEEALMFVIAESASTVVRLDGRFDRAQARALEEILSRFRPVRNVVVDFRNLRDVDPAAVASLVGTLGALSESCVTFRGLTSHVRRVLRYVGAEVDDPAGADREPRLRRDVPAASP